MASRICKICGEPRAETGRCKSCNKIRCLAYYHKHKKRIADYHKQQREMEPDRVCGKCGELRTDGFCRNCKNTSTKIYYPKYKKRIADRVKQQREMEPDQVCGKCGELRTDGFCRNCQNISRRARYQRRKNRIEDNFSEMIGLLLNRTKHTCKHNCTLVRADLICLWERQRGFCALTGIPMETKRRSPKRISIDRIDNAGDYTPNNIQLVCQWANLARGPHTVEEFLAVLEELRMCESMSRSV